MDNGFTSPSTDEPLAGNPRVHEEGRENYERNHKSHDWFGHNSAVTDTRPESRHLSDAAKANALKNRGTMQETLKNYADQTKSKTNGSQDLENHDHVDRGREATNGIIEKISDLAIASEPKVKHSEVVENKEQSQGSHNSTVSHVVPDAGPQPVEPQQQLPPPQAAAEAAVKAEHPQPPTKLDLAVRENSEPGRKSPVPRSEGARTPRESRQGRLHMESSSGGWDESPPHHRLRLDGESIAQKNNADSVTEIFVQSSTSPRWKEPKIMSDSNTPRKPPPPRVNSDGLRNMKKAMNQSEMSAIMHGSPVQSAPPQQSSGRKILPHMRKSELW